MGLLWCHLIRLNNFVYQGCCDTVFDMINAAYYNKPWYLSRKRSGRSSPPITRQWTKLISAYLRGMQERIPVCLSQIYVYGSTKIKISSGQFEAQKILGAKTKRTMYAYFISRHKMDIVNICCRNIEIINKQNHFLVVFSTIDKPWKYQRKIV